MSQSKKSSKKVESSSIFLFHRSLRLDDNLGLLNCCKKSSEVFPIFCIDPRQAESKNNKHFTPYALDFMNKSLLELDTELKKHKSQLHMLYGEPHLVLDEFIKKHNIKYLFMNKDYTPFARKRTLELVKMCDLINKTRLDDNKVAVVEIDDYLLYGLDGLFNKAGKVYKVYTYFLKKTISSDDDVKKPIKASKSILESLTLDDSVDNKKAWDVLNDNIPQDIVSDVVPGRNAGIKILLDLNKTQAKYGTKRDYLTYQTSRLSPYIKFGCVSMREVWHMVDKMSNAKSKEILHKQLIWREFYYHLYICYPEELEWDKPTKQIKVKDIIEKAPKIVQACIVQLITTGFLHNRGRMILATYLLHDKKYYWKDCDRFFANNLVDYDPFVNIGNWRWIEKQPPFKQIKPETQQKKWDKDNIYINKYPISLLAD